MASTQATVPAGDSAPAPKRDRSPNFPAISLPDALKKIETIYKEDGRTATGVKVILKHLGYGENLSGSAGRMVSALRQYGLLEDVGDDKYRVSDAAVRILELSDESAARREAIEASARKPAVFREILKTYAERLPSDAALRDHLITELKFNPASVESFIRALKGTVGFAKLYQAKYTPPKETNDRPKLGDYIQWESQGVDQFAVPAKVTGLSQDGAFVLVEGTQTGIPVEQARKVEAPSQSVSMPFIQSTAQAFPAVLSSAGAANFKGVGVAVAREVSSLEEGEAVLQWPATMSPESVLELEAWLTLVVKKMKRRAGVETK